MGRTVTATEARVHFGELMRQVVETGEAVTVERSGSPEVVIAPVAEWERLRALSGKRWDDWWTQVQALRARIEAERGDRDWPAIDAAQMIADMREERSREVEEALDALRGR